MMIVSRKLGEAIVINDNITIRVVDIQEHKTRLGVDAPKEVPVHRQEVADAIREEQEREDKK